LIASRQRFSQKVALAGKCTLFDHLHGNALAEYSSALTWFLG
jgi:hypothetical protein